MQTTVQKWGNSLAVRIPKPFVEETHLAPGSEVDLSLSEGRIVIMPQPVPKFDLARLLHGVTSHNKHGEAETGSAVGREVW